MAVLEISSWDSGDIRWCATMASGDEITLAFIHSVNKRPVYDTLRVEDNHLVIVKSRYDAFGAGMPEATTAHGTFRILDDGWMEWTVNRPVPEIVVRVGRVAQHTLIIKGREIRLTELARPGSALALRVRRFSLLHHLKGRCFRE